MDSPLSSSPLVLPPPPSLSSLYHSRLPAIPLPLIFSYLPYRDVVRHLSHVDSLFFSSCLSPSSYANGDRIVLKPQQFVLYWEGLGHSMGCHRGLSDHPINQTEGEEGKEEGKGEVVASTLRVRVGTGGTDDTQDLGEKEGTHGGDTLTRRGTGTGTDRPKGKDSAPSSSSSLPSPSPLTRSFFIPFLRLCRELSIWFDSKDQHFDLFYPAMIGYFSSSVSSSPHLKHLEWGDSPYQGIGADLLSSHNIQIPTSHRPSFPNLHSMAISLGVDSDQRTFELASLIHQNFAPRLEKLEVRRVASNEKVQGVLRNLSTALSHSLREIKLDSEQFHGEILLDFALLLESLPSVALESFKYDGDVTLREDLDVTLDGVGRHLPKHSSYPLYRLLSVFPSTMKTLSIEDDSFALSGPHVAALFLRRFPLLETLTYVRRHRSYHVLQSEIQQFLSWGGPPVDRLGVNVESITQDDFNIYLQLRHIPSLRTLEVREFWWLPVERLLPPVAIPSTLEDLEVEMGGDTGLAILVEMVSVCPRLRFLTVRLKAILQPSDLAKALSILARMKSLRRVGLLDRSPSPKRLSTEYCNQLFILLQDAFQGREEELERLRDIVDMDNHYQNQSLFATLRRARGGDPIRQC